MSRAEDTLDTGDLYAKARLYQQGLGAFICVLGVIALAFGNPELALILVGIGAKLMPTGTFMGPKG